MAKDKVSMQDIADFFGVSKVTVSKAINNKSGISESLKRDIIKKAEEMGYKLNTAYKKKSTSNYYAFIVPKKYYFENEGFYTSIHYYLQKKVTKEGATLFNFVINEKEELENIIPEKLSGSNFDGLFISGQFSYDYLKALSDLSLPTVAIDFTAPGMPFDSIVSDNFYLGYLVTQYLIDKGHKKIGFVGGIRDTISITDRYFGYLKAMELADLHVDSSWNIVNNHHGTGLYHFNYDLPAEKLDAYVCHCDTASYYLIQKLLTVGLSVPDDVSVIGIDNTDICTMSNPKLTTINIDKREFAYKSYEQMQKRIENRNVLPVRVYVGHNLIERESVGIK